MTKQTNGRNSVVAEGAIKVPGIPVGLSTLKISSSNVRRQKKAPSNPQTSLQFVLNSMFSSCTSGGNDFEIDSIDDSTIAPSSLLKHTARSRTGATTAITPTSSREETCTTGPVTPSPLHQPKPVSAVKSALKESSKILFTNNHDIAEEAIHRLRQQHQRDHAEKIVTDSLYESEVAVDTERDRSVRSKTPSMFSNNPSMLSLNPSTMTNYRTVSSSLQEPERAKQQQQQPSSRKSSVQKSMAPRQTSSNQNNIAKAPAANKPSGKTLVRARQEHSFFPASRPRDAPGSSRQEQQRLKDKLQRNKGVPKEVTPTSPIRMLKTRNKQRQKQILNAPSTDDNFVDANFNNNDERDENRDANDSWDIGNDGISDITEATVDRMILAIAKHIRVFPEEAETLNRIHSDITDPAPIRGAIQNNDASSVEASSYQFFPMIGGAVAGFTNGATLVTPPRGGDAHATKGMSPHLFTRNIGSNANHSFFSKTTQSTQTNDFANVWKIDEQQFWDTEVANESNKDLFKGHTSPSRMTVMKRRKQRSGTTTTATSITVATTPTTSFSSHQSPLSRFHRKHEDHTSREVFLTDHDKLMDNLVLQNDVEMAEI